MKEARKRLQTEQVVEGIRNYSYHGKLTLWALAMVEQDQSEPVRTRDIYEPYEMVCEKEGQEPVSNRAVREYLSELETLGIVSSTEVNRGLDGGVYKEHSLNQPVSAVKAGLSEFVDTTE